MAMKRGQGKEIVSPDRDLYDMTETHKNNVIEHNKKKLVVTSDTAYDNNKNCINGSVSEKEEAPIWVPKFVIGLTNKEKEEDFLVFKGSKKLPPRPKKRARFMQRTINVVSPGTRLSKLSIERYEVREKNIPKKRAKGLKAMCNMESESESE